MAASATYVNAQESERNVPNILIVTVDDMSADSIGAFGSELSDTTPQIDAFAKTALKFNHAHVQVGNCMPGRNLMWSGLYSHVNGVEGFQQNKSPDYPVLCDLAQAAGYFTAIRGKVSHSTPYSPYSWDADVTKKPGGGQFHVKDPQSYGKSVTMAIEMAREAKKPFCLMVNISDPHKPFFNRGKGNSKVKDPFVPSRIFQASEVPVPGFLPEDEVIRDELASYYSTVRRADDCFGHVMSALDDSGKGDETFVMFFSDHGMPLPFAKTQLYHHSTHTPLLIRWPGVTGENNVDDLHMVSAIDFLPTLLDVMRHPHPVKKRLHGRSFAALLRGNSQLNRDHVILQYNENSGRFRHPMRGIQTKEFLYLFNPWSDGKRKFATATTGTATYRQMVKRASHEPKIAARLELFDHRVLEELYDVRTDSDCLVNLIDTPEYESRLRELRVRLVAELERTGDPVAPVLRSIDDSSVRSAYMASEDAKKARVDAERRRKRQDSKKQKPAGRKKKTAAASPKSGLPGAIRFGKLGFDATTEPGATVDVVIHHQLPRQLGVEKLHVTLKRPIGDEDSGSVRIERKVVSVEGDGQQKISFVIPDDLLTTAPMTRSVMFAAFVGPDFDSSLTHIVSPKIKVVGAKAE